MLLRHRHPLKLVNNCLLRLNLKPTSIIEIHWFYPRGFDAVFSADERVYVLKFNLDKFYAIEIHPIRGYWPSGNLIIK